MPPSPPECGSLVKYGSLKPSNTEHAGLEPCGSLFNTQARELLEMSNATVLRQRNILPRSVLRMTKVRSLGEPKRRVEFFTQSGATVTVDIARRHETEKDGRLVEQRTHHRLH